MSAVKSLATKLWVAAVPLSIEPQKDKAPMLNAETMAIKVNKVSMARKPKREPPFACELMAELLATSLFWFISITPFKVALNHLF